MSTATPVRAAVELDLDLRGHDFAARRRCLFAALRCLHPGDELVVISTRPGELRWLRYEMEARMEQRYRWSRSAETRAGDGVHTVVRLPD